LGELFNVFKYLGFLGQAFFRGVLKSNIHRQTPSIFGWHDGFVLTWKLQKQISNIYSICKGKN
jgi:hypothetical protein